MEKPTIDPVTGHPLWRANGERQRFYDRMFEEVDHISYRHMRSVITTVSRLLSS